MGPPNFFAASKKVKIAGKRLETTNGVDFGGRKGEESREKVKKLTFEPRFGCPNEHEGVVFGGNAKNEKVWHS
jgi:hypothetical protein